MQRSPRFDPAESDREFSIAASDYTVSILADPLLRLVKRTAPRIRLNLHPLPAALPHAPHVLSTDDLVIGPVGYDFPGRRVELFRDRFVCVVDPAASRARRRHRADAWRTWPGCRTPRPRSRPARTPRWTGCSTSSASRRRTAVTVFGWLSVPFVLAGHRHGRDHAGADGAARDPQHVSLAVLEPPFGLVELVEAAYWHPSRTDDPAVRWLLRTLQEPRAALSPPAIGAAPVSRYRLVMAGIANQVFPPCRRPLLASAHDHRPTSVASRSRSASSGARATARRSPGWCAATGCATSPGSARSTTCSPTGTTRFAGWTSLRPRQSTAASWTDLAGLDVRCPVRPGQILQCGANYRKHVVDIVMAERRADLSMTGHNSDVPEAEVRAWAENMMDERARTGSPYVFTGLPSALTGPYDDDRAARPRRQARLGARARRSSSAARLGT